MLQCRLQPKPGTIILSRRFLAGLLCLLSLLAAPAAAQAPQAQPQRPFAVAVEQWARTLDATMREIDQGQIFPAHAADLKQRLAEIDAEAKAVKKNAQAALAPLEEQLQSLGPEPAEGEPPEAAEIVEQRTKFKADIADYQARVQRADLAMTRVKELTLKINELTLERTIAELFVSFPLPFAPGTAATAGPDFFRILANLGTAPADWWRSLSPDQQGTVLYRVALFLVPALLLAWFLRRALLRYFGRDPAIESPTYTRRLTGAVAEGLAHGIVPSFILAAIFLRAQSDTTLISGLFADVVVVGCAAAIMFILAWALPRAVLAPGLPAWRLIPFTAENARTIDRRIIYVAAVFAIDVFVANTGGKMAPTAELVSLYTFVLSTMEAVGILLLTQSRLWVWEQKETEVAEAERAPQKRAGGFGFWSTLRRIAALLALGAVLSAAIGYATLSGTLIENLIVSGMAIGALFLLRGFLRELTGVALRSRFMQVQLALPHKSRQRYKFWLRALLDVVIYLGGAVVVLMIWGVPGEDIYASSRGVLQEFSIGNVTISLGDILVAILVFIAAVTVTRAIQRALTERVFPQTNLDVGIQNSLSSGFGYVGLAIAIMLAISAIGLDLSNIALIAGALSVGIGFGLQAIINNFVSGLILLIERPIKVGDWIIAGGHEGTVKRINVRATEIETFQRAAIIIPNSELITGAVTNWTHRDRFGRVEVPVGVAYGSDVEKVMEILKKCMQDHEAILPWPEPFVVFLRFGESSLDFEARGYIGDVERRIRVLSELNTAVERALREADIEIPFPQRDLHIRSATPLEFAQRQGAAAAASKAKTDPETQDTAEP